MITLCLFTFFLASCWDQNLLVNKKMVNGISFDLDQNDNVLATVRALNIENKGGGQFEVKDELVKVNRPSVSGMEVDINNKLPGLIDVSKAHIILIGRELARKGIYPYLELFYRPRQAYVSTRVVIAENKASDIITLNPGTSPIAFVILKGLEAAEDTTKIPKETAFTAWTQITDTGRDIVLPFVTKDENDKITIGGIDLFNGDKFSGISLPNEKGSLLLLLMDRLNKYAEMAVQLGDHRSISYRVKTMKRDLDLKVDKKTKKITCRINLTLDLTITSYTGKVGEKLNKDKLNKDVSKILTKQSDEITKSLLEANCDALGIGGILSSSYPDIWKKINWDKEYKNVKFKTSVKAKIDRTGPVF
ncbi:MULTISPECIES: Ger(x)C family spore germination protein [unclassified Bacillus (in: firmicutes)]|uniref:Ger(x)C family spore germination protein n=1 Tax=unclassified Bacillus (in: firmicutes) TaxID=185979 RepID=UPI0025701441|nr:MULTISPECIES: Ger(x)C family spore germination protein [unclassified Bacillus (in: firmicutes)]